MTLRAISAAAAAEALEVSGIVPVRPEDDLPLDIRTVLLLSPAEPAFWTHYSASPEALDGRPDPLDRWSARVIGTLAEAVGARALFPFGGPPWLPFYGWALRSGRAWPSPVALLVHDTAGLFVSYRGALALSEEVPADPGGNPCTTCEGQPCRGACPVGALTPAGYDLPLCHGFLDSAAGSSCMGEGCAVRRACPVGRDRRDPAQSAFHMRAFHPR